MEAEGERSSASDVGGTGQSVSIRTTSRNNTTRPTTGEMVPASSVSEQVAILSHGNTDGAITLAAWFAKSALISHVENGAVNGDAASTINNQVHAARIMRRFGSWSGREQEQRHVGAWIRQWHRRRFSEENPDSQPMDIMWAHVGDGFRDETFMSGDQTLGTF
jgi:hypothetical protein